MHTGLQLESKGKRKTVLGISYLTILLQPEQSLQCTETPKLMMWSLQM